MNITAFHPLCSSYKKEVDKIPITLYHSKVVKYKSIILKHEKKMCKEGFKMVKE